MGRKSAAQTPAPKSDRIKGSKTNKAGSAASKKSASSIVVSDKVLKTLKDKADKYNENHTSKVSVNTLKAVFRRGSGAYSTSHRPTITGGAPNSRNAWSFARVNKFLLKKGGTKVKAAYVQDDDLMAKGGIIAPNGEKSNLTPEQYKLVRTPEFKAWFGDWENEPKNASKVVDENGEPLVVYHGAYDYGFTIFSKKHRGISTGAKSAKKGFYFYDKEDDAKNFSKRSAGGGIYKVFLKIKNPNKKNFESKNVDADNELLNLISLTEYDGAIAINLKDGYEIGNQYVVFEPEQIKLADGKNTTFDIDNQDIRYKDGGKLFNDKELLAKWKKGESIGFTGEAHLKAKGLIPRTDGTKRKSEKYMEDGGQLGKEVICVNCSWYWNTNESQDSDKYVCHKCGFDNRFFYTDDFPNMQKFDEFADGRLKGAEKITNDSKEKGGLSMLTYYHYNAKLPTYEQASKGGFDLEKAKKEFEELQSQLSYNMKQIEFQEVMGKMEVLGELIIEEMSLVPENIENTTFEEEFKDGGVVVGKRHSEEDENGTGERFLVESTGQVVEVEGGEGVLSKESMSSDKKYDLDGEKLTGRQIASKLNHKYGGIEFAEGGEVGHVCGCRSKKYMHGGELPSATLQGLSGGEAVVTVKTMQSKDSYNFQGKKMNPRQILSKINADSGGKKFEEGGTIDLTKNIMEKELKLTKMVYFTENILYS